MSLDLDLPPKRPKSDRLTAYRPLSMVGKDELGDEAVKDLATKKVLDSYDITYLVFGKIVKKENLDEWRRENMKYGIGSYRDYPDYMLVYSRESQFIFMVDEDSLRKLTFLTEFKKIRHVVNFDREYTPDKKLVKKEFRWYIGIHTRHTFGDNDFRRENNFIAKFQVVDVPPINKIFLKQQERIMKLQKYIINLQNDIIKIKVNLNDPRKLITFSTILKDLAHHIALVNQRMDEYDDPNYKDDEDDNQ